MRERIQREERGKNRREIRERRELGEDEGGEETEVRKGDRRQRG